MLRRLTNRNLLASLWLFAWIISCPDNARAHLFDHNIDSSVASRLEEQQRVNEAIIAEKMRKDEAADRVRRAEFEELQERLRKEERARQFELQEQVRRREAQDRNISQNNNRDKDTKNEIDDKCRNSYSFECTLERENLLFQKQRDEEAAQMEQRRQERLEKKRVRDEKEKQRIAELNEKRSNADYYVPSHVITSSVHRSSENENQPNDQRTSTIESGYAHSLPYSYKSMPTCDINKMWNWISYKYWEYTMRNDHELSYFTKYLAFIAEASTAECVPMEVLLDLLKKEWSHWNPKARPRLKNWELASSAVWLSQMIDSTWEENLPNWADVDSDRYNPRHQIRSMAIYLSRIKFRQQCDWDMAKVYYHTWEWWPTSENLNLFLASNPLIKRIMVKNKIPFTPEWYMTAAKKYYSPKKGSNVNTSTSSNSQRPSTNWRAQLSSWKYEPVSKRESWDSIYYPQATDSNFNVRPISWAYYGQRSWSYSN